MIKSVVAVTLGFVLSCFAQERFTSGELTGFLKSPSEHVIAHVDAPFTVSRTVQGIITLKGKDDPLSNVTFEIRGPGGLHRIRATRSSSAGRFSFGAIPEGTYAFKATKEGFQSVVGTIIVSRKTDRRKRLTVEMPLGV